MNSSINRDRLIRDGSHCRCCSVWELRVAGDAVRKISPHGQRLSNFSRHGRSKPKGQHAYRRGLVS